MTAPGPVPPAAVSTAHRPDLLRRDLTSRQVSMLALGGTIGAGLFVGSGAVVSAAGPVAVLAYLLGGAVVILSMRMIAEMAVVRPSAGSLSDWPREALGPAAGFVTGWLYWYSWVVVIAFEAVAGAAVLREYLDLPLALLSAIILVSVLLVNASSVRRFGQAEYWLAMIKVVAIVLFLGVCALVLVGAWPGRDAGAPGLADQPLAPDGALPVLTGLLVVLFSYAGTEIVAVAAAETDDPARSLRRATRSVVARILLFYVGSITAIVLLLPRAQTPEDSSPFAAVLDDIGVPAAGAVMNGVVLCALVSAMNSALYVCSRMLFGLAQAGDAPQRYADLDRRGVPRRALVLSGALAGAAVLVAVVSPDTAFLVLLGAASSVIVPIYLLLALSQLRLRRRWESEDPAALQVRMWWFPYGTYLLIGVMVAITVGLFALPEFLPQAVLTSLAVLVAFVAYRLRARRATVTL